MKPMSLITCPKCNRQVSNSANFCPLCGFPISEKKPKIDTSSISGGKPKIVTSQATRDKNKKQKSLADNKGCWIVFLIILAIPLIAPLFDTSNDGNRNKKTSTSTSTSTETEALTRGDTKMYANMRIEKMLKSPSSAKFCRVTKCKFTPISNGWNIKGYVDSQNGFGAMLRNNYSVNVYRQNGKILTEVEYLE